MIFLLYSGIAFASWDYLWFIDMGQWQVADRVILFFSISAAVVGDAALLTTLWRKK